MKPDIVRRYGHNPILTKAEIPYPVETVHNAAVVKHEDAYIMLFRSHLRTGRSIIGLARSPDGFHFTADPEPFLIPARDSPFAAYEEFGVEDPRVTRLEGEYIITYSAYSRHGVRIALAKTKDFSQVERVSLITQADYRNVVIFPEKFDGLYARLDRPHSAIAPWSIWISHIPPNLVVGPWVSHTILDTTTRYPHHVSSSPTAICMEMRHGTECQTDTPQPHHHRRFPR